MWSHCGVSHLLRRTFHRTPRPSAQSAAVLSTLKAALRMGTCPAGRVSVRASFTRQCTSECWLYCVPPRSAPPTADVNTSEVQPTTPYQHRSAVTAFFSFLLLVKQFIHQNILLFQHLRPLSCSHEYFTLLKVYLGRAH